MGDKTCGTCIHYRCAERPLWDGHPVHTTLELCAADPYKMCSYTCPSCQLYAPDQEYINFMNKTRDA